MTWCWFLESASRSVIKNSFSGKYLPWIIKKAFHWKADRCLLRDKGGGVITKSSPWELVRNSKGEHAIFPPSPWRYSYRPVWRLDDSIKIVRLNVYLGRGSLLPDRAYWFFGTLIGRYIFNVAAFLKELINMQGNFCPFFFSGVGVVACWLSHSVSPC